MIMRLKANKFRLIILVLIIICFAFIYFVKKEQQTPDTALNQPLENLTETVYPFYDKNLFFTGVNEAKQNPKTVRNIIYAGIVPHHALGSSIIASFFELLKNQNPHTLIVIGPNHEERGDSAIITSTTSWDSPFGEVKPDENLVRSISNIAQIDDESLHEEHSIGALVPYIKYYLPNVYIVPIMVKYNLTPKEMDDLVNFIASNTNAQTLTIGSIDFSHYLPQIAALNNDKFILKLIDEKSYSEILKLNSDYLDSSSVLVAILSAMENMNHKSYQILDHINSGAIADNPTAPSTSYINMIFY